MRSSLNKVIIIIIIMHVVKMIWLIPNKAYASYVLTLTPFVTNVLKRWLLTFTHKIK